MIDWHPIETAPKRSFKALVKLPDGSVTIGYHQNYYQWGWACAVLRSGGGQADYWGTDSSVQPTHFALIE